MTRTESERVRETQRDREGQLDTESDRTRQRGKHTEGQRDRQTDIQASKQASK